MIRATAGFSILLLACKHDAPATTYVDARSEPVFASASAASSASAIPSAAANVDVPKNVADTAAQAQGELGYAQLRAGKLDDALETLRDALALLPSDFVESQLEFNVGLVYEKKGDAERARAAFARANAKHSSAASRSKLSGKSMCPASVVKDAFVPGSAYALTTSWRDVYAFAAARGANLLSTLHDWTITPSSDADAKKLLASDCAGAPPWTIGVGHLMFSDGHVYVAPLSGGRMLAIDGEMSGGGCTGMGARPAATSTARLHGTIVEMTSTVEWWTDVTCKKGSARTETTTTFYDPDGLKVVTISAAATLSGRTITIAGCDPVSI